MASTKIPLTRYQLRLLVFLSVAVFFEGFDVMALSQILPNVRADLGLDKRAAGVLITVANSGAVLAYLLIRLADRWGRRPLLTVTIAGYTISTFFSGLAPEAVTLALCQMLARMFLLAEYAISMMYAAEEFPAERRGMVIALIAGIGSLGSIVCAGVTPLLLQTPWGWRSVFFVGIVPLLLLAFARRNLRETERFATQGRAGDRRPFTAIWKTPYRRRVIELAAIWGVVYICAQNAVFFWKDFALTERGLSDEQIGLAIALAALASVPVLFAVGPFIDRFGRKPGSVIIFTMSAVGVFCAYSLQDRWPLTTALVLTVSSMSAMLPLLNAFTTELFPTHLRGDAYAWSNNLLGRMTYVISPFIVGSIAQQSSWGATLSVTAVFPIIAVVMIVVLLPETRGRELEDTAAL